VMLPTVTVFAGFSSHMLFSSFDPGRSCTACVGPHSVATDRDILSVIIAAM
jgi:hypothetical protein